MALYVFTDLGQVRLQDALLLKILNLSQCMLKIPEHLSEDGVPITVARNKKIKHYNTHH